MAKRTRTAKAVSLAKKATAKRTSKRSGPKPDLKRHIGNVEKAFEELKRENEGKEFTFIAADEIERKLRTGDPQFSGMGWNPDTTPGGNVTFAVSVYNPGPMAAESLYVHAWVGSGIVDWSDEFLLDVDTRFPRLTEPGFVGATIGPASSATFSFSLEVPNTIQRTKYFLIICLLKFPIFFKFSDHRLLDRSMFAINVA